MSHQHKTNLLDPTTFRSRHFKKTFASQPQPSPLRPNKHLSMSSSVQQFITQVVNKNQLVKSSRLEITLKALICNAGAFGKGKGTAIHFLNCLRVLSFMRKAKFCNHFKYESFISVMEKKIIDLDIGIVFKDKHINPDVKKELKALTQYIVYCAYLFKDTWLLEPLGDLAA